MKPCPSFPGYSATEDGRVFTNRRRTRVSGTRGTFVVIDSSYARELKQQPVEKGYRSVSVAVGNGKSRPICVQVMVLDAHVGPRPDGTQARHLDGNPANNTLANLAWGTPKENAADRQRHGHYDRGSEHRNARLGDGAVRAILDQRAAGTKVRDLAVSAGVSVTTIESILYGRTWKHVTAGRVEFKVAEVRHA